MNNKLLESLLVALLLVGVSFASPGKETEWPAWRGGQYGGTLSQGALDGASGLRVSWLRAVGSAYSAIVVAQGRVVTMASDHTNDYVIALDEESGDELWREPIAKTYPGRDGATDGPSSTPVIDGDAVFALGPFGDLVALDLQTGQKRWSTHLVNEHSSTVPHWGFTTSPLVYDNLLVVATGGATKNMVTAFNKHTGQIVWTAGDDNINYQSPLVMRLDGRDQIICAGDEKLYGLRPADGVTLWQTPHEGRRFYAKIVNPVIVDEGKLFMTCRFSDSKLITLKGDQNGYEIIDGWKSKHFKASYNIVAYHDNYLYGYSGGFLVCIDATSGELAWKSRPPGTGFLVAVDGHLVVIARKGSLHIVKASPDAYHEVASIKLFTKRVWTPPSFANGHIYVRNEYAMAKVAILKDDVGTVSQVSRDPRLTVPGSKFSEFISVVAQTSDKGKILDQFMREQEHFPIIEGDSLAHIVYRGDATDLAIQGDMFETRAQVPMRHVAGTDFYYASFKLDPGALLGYQFIEDLGSPGPDPLNANKASDGIALGGEVSLIRMPAFEESLFLEDRRDREGGRIDTVEFNIEPQDINGLTWSGSRKLKVYLPAGYDASEVRYPVIYVHYGDLALGAGKMKTILDNTIGRTVAPHIAVFAPSVSGYEYARSHRDVYAEALVNKMVPLIDARYRTVAKASARAILGGDEGGFGALYVAFKYPNVFGRVAAQSAMPIAEGEGLLLELISTKPKIETTFYLDWGKYDQRLTLAGTNIARSGRLLMQRLRAAGYHVVGGETPNGAGFPNWRLQTHKILETFFPIGSN